MNSVTAHGIEIAYRQTGTGAPLVFIHGYSYESSTWEPQLAYFGSKYRAIAYDVRGHGATTVASSGYTVAGFASDLGAFLDALGIQRAVLCGLSMGGMIAMEFALTQPERVAGLVLADTTPGSTAGAAEDLVARLSGYYADGLEPIVDAVGERFYGRRFRESHPDFTGYWRGKFLRNSLQALTGAVLAMANRERVTPRLAAIGVPTLVLLGAEDIVAPLAASQELADAIPGAALVEIPGSGHLSNEEAPDAFNAAVAAFLERHGL